MLWQMTFYYTNGMKYVKVVFQSMITGQLFTLYYLIFYINSCLRLSKRKNVHSISTAPTEVIEEDVTAKEESMEVMERNPNIKRKANFNAARRRYRLTIYQYLAVEEIQLMTTGPR